ncbi:MAG TPA: hypothetical protein VF576_05780 [Rubricoccaceae bacterium]|jgi:hypothetical protein
MKPILTLVAVLSLTGCDSMSGAETRYPGELLRNDPNTEAIAAPDTVVAGRPFTVTVVTQGGGCDEKGDVLTSVERMTAEVRPFDVSLYEPGGWCTAILKYFEHRATVTFAQPGTATIRAVGTGDGRGLGPPPVDAPLVTVERTVVVVPSGS